MLVFQTNPNNKEVSRHDRVKPFLKIQISEVKTNSSNNSKIQHNYSKAAMLER